MVVAIHERVSVAPILAIIGGRRRLMIFMLGRLKWRIACGSINNISARQSSPALALLSFVINVVFVVWYLAWQYCEM